MTFQLNTFKPKAKCSNEVASIMLLLVLYFPVFLTPSTALYRKVHVDCLHWAARSPCPQRWSAGPCEGFNIARELRVRQHPCRN